MRTTNVMRDVIKRWRQVDHSLFVLFFGALLYMARLLGPGWKGKFDSFFPDSYSYLKVAKLGPFDPSFWLAERPVGVPLLLWFSRFDNRTFILLQTLIFVGAIIFLCRTILASLALRPLAWATCGLVGAIAIQPRFGVWNLELLSESLGMSLSILALTCWFRVTQSFSVRRMWVAVFSTVAWMLVRDSHGLPILVVMVTLGFVAYRQSNRDLRRTLLRCLAILLVTFSYISMAQGVSNRNQYPLMNNVGVRILPDLDMTATYIERGMPSNETLQARTGRNTWDDGEIFLQSPQLIEFRSWVNGSGQTDQLISLVADFPFWLEVVESELPGALAYDFHDYDRFDTLQRLPAQTLGFDSPRTVTQLWVWLLATLAGIVALFTLTRDRRTPSFLLVALAAILVEIYTSIAGDAVEVQRHLIGPLFRIFILSIVAMALGMHALILALIPYFNKKFGRKNSNSDQTSPQVLTPIRLGSALTRSTWALLFLIGFFALEKRSQDFDPQYTLTIVERAAKYGGSYYQNGIHNKGPLETALYDSARIFTSSGSYWFGISLYILSISLALAICMAAITRIVGGSRTLAITMASLTFIHFALSSSDYAGVIYSRNLTTIALALVFAWCWWPPAWSSVERSRWSYVMSFVALGLAVQTLLTTIFAAVVIGLAVILHRGRHSGFTKPLIVSITTFIATILSAPAWYGLRGSFHEFWSGWWTYARFMSAGTGRSFVDQAHLGWEQTIDYYQDRLLLLALITLFIFATWLLWKTLPRYQKILQVTLILWLISGWIELILGQRYSSHYFSVVAIPTFFMAAVLFTQLSISSVQRSTDPHSPPKRPRFSVVLIASSMLIGVQCSQLFWSGLSGLGTFTTFDKHEQNYVNGYDGQVRTARAIIDLVSHSGDPLLAWTMYPWTYLNQERVPATRFSWKSFMIGEIYLGRTGPEYVLPETWKWFRQDIEESQPRTFIRPQETTLDETTPLAKYVSENFATVYDGNSLEVSLMRSDWVELNSTPAATLELDGETILSPTTPTILSPRQCVRIAGVLDSLTTKSSGVIFGFVDPTGKFENVYLSLDPSRAASSSDAVEFASQTISGFEDAKVEFLLVVGSRSAVLIVDQKVVAATRLGNESRISVASLNGQPSLSNMRIDDQPPLDGCPNS